MKIFARFAKDESGATAIEYGLIAALMAIIVIAAMMIIGPALEDTFQSIDDSLNTTTSTELGLETTVP